MHKLLILIKICYFYQLECTQISPNYLFIETCHPIAHKACQNIYQIPILNTFLKSQICAQTMALLKNHIQIFKCTVWLC